jgi:hypothetical protein
LPHSHILFYSPLPFSPNIFSANHLRTHKKWKIHICLFHYPSLNKINTNLILCPIATVLFWLYSNNNTLCFVFTGRKRTRVSRGETK